MKLLNYTLGAVLLMAASAAHATTVLYPTDGDINFSVQIGDLSGYTLAIFDDQTALDSASTDRIEVVVPELIFWDSSTTTLSNGDNSQSLIIADGDFVLGVSNNVGEVGETWIGGDITDVGGFVGALFFKPEINSYTFTFDQLEVVAAIDLAPVPVPAAAWLFASGLIGLVAVSRRKA